MILDMNGVKLSKILPTREAFDRVWDEAVRPLELVRRQDDLQETSALLWPLESWWRYVYTTPAFKPLLHRARKICHIYT